MATNENWNGINTEGVEKIMVDILDYTERANKILNNISVIVADTSTCFDCESGANFRNQFELIKSGFTTFNKNFLSYNTDLMRVVQNYQLRSDFGVSIMSEGEKSVSVSLEQKEEN